MMQDLKSSEPHDAMVRRIMFANTDLEERLHQMPLRLGYESSEDLLYVDFGEPQPSATESIREKTFSGLRVNPATLKLNGLELHRFSYWLARSPTLRALLAFVIEHTTVQEALPGAVDAREANQELSGLVSRSLEELLVG